MKLELTEAQAMSTMGALDASAKMVAQQLMADGLNGAKSAAEALARLIELADIVQAGINAQKARK